MGTPTIEVLADAASVASRAATLVAQHAREAVADQAGFSLAVSGGRSPWAMFAALADQDMPWQQTTVYQVDERVAPAGDADRNLVHLQASLPRGGDTVVVGMPVEDEDLEAATERYAASLPASFDLVHLGLGADGHTASLVPGDAVLEVSDRAVALTSTYQGRRRMTLTYPAIARAKRVLFLVTGEDKRDALSRLLAGDHAIPAGRVDVADMHIIADRAARPSS